MINVTVNRGEIKCKIEGVGLTILSELTILVDDILDKMAEGDDDNHLTKVNKDELVELFCNGLNHLNGKE